jgi:hypothetical protein
MKTICMRGSTIGRSLFVALLAVTCCATLSASPIFGSFDFAGTITATLDTITWTNNNAAQTPDQATIGTLATGSFAGVLASGDLIAINNLSRTAEPVFSPDHIFTPAQNFITFDTLTGLPTLMINQIFSGIHPNTQCDMAPAAGQVCTTGPPVSPFNFVNNSGLSCCQATASFGFSGVTADGLSQWEVNFTSQFNVPFQTLLAQLSSEGSVTNTFSATVLVAPITGVPEPGPATLMGLGLGLVVLSAGLRRRLS